MSIYDTLNKEQREAVYHTEDHFTSRREQVQERQEC